MIAVPIIALAYAVWKNNNKHSIAFGVAGGIILSLHYSSIVEDALFPYLGYGLILFYAVLTVVRKIYRA